jgi:RNA polymerase sigma-70 factor (ECF subfamily)
MEATLTRARAGDEAALRELYEANRGRVLRLATAILGDPDEAEDVMQDVCVYALTHLSEYDQERAAFTTWLHTITVSRCRDRIRRRRYSLSRLAALWRADPRPESDPAQGLGAIAAAAMLKPGLAHLTPLQREALALRYVEDLSFEDMGRVLNIPMRTAQTRVTGALAALRRTLGGVPEDVARPAPAEVKSG